MKHNEMNNYTLHETNNSQLCRITHKETNYAEFHTEWLMNYADLHTEWLIIHNEINNYAE